MWTHVKLVSQSCNRFHVQLLRCVNEKLSLTSSPIPKTFFLLYSKMTTRSQKRKAVAELVSREFEASVAENNSSENLVAGPRKTLRVELENLDEIFEKRNHV